jgi:hypothetical protein
MPLYKVQKVKIWSFLLITCIWINHLIEIWIWCKEPGQVLVWQISLLLFPNYGLHSHLYYSDELKCQNLKVCLLLHVSCALKLNTWFIITNKMIESETNSWMETIIFVRNMTIVFKLFRWLIWLSFSSVFVDFPSWIHLGVRYICYNLY